MHGHPTYVAGCERCRRYAREYMRQPALGAGCRSVEELDRIAAGVAAVADPISLALLVWLFEAR